MRKSPASLAVCLCLGMASPAVAQFWSGVNPRPVSITPSNTSSFVQPRNVTGAFKPPSQAKPFSLANIFHPVSLPSFPPRHGVSTYPTAAQMLQQQQAAQPSAVGQFFQSVGNFLSPY